MSCARILSSVAAVAAVGGCAVVAVGMSRAATGGATISSDPTSTPRPAPTSRPAVRPVTPTTGTTPVATAAATAVASPSGRPTSSHPFPSTRPAPTATQPSATSHAPDRPAVVVPRAPASRRATHAAPAPSPTRAAYTGQALPLQLSTGTATRVVTVVAHSYGSTTATLQAWDRVAGGWRKVGSSMTAHLGADGLSTRASEYRSATPIGSFTLTRAFGRDSDPGTNLPYRHTTAADWWISQAGPLYNTHQICPSSCAFDRGSNSVNEHLYYESPYYDYAVVIDYNTRNAPGGVRQGAGSAFFLHVAPPGSGPTAGCVSIPYTRLVTIMRWLTPSAHPRILIGLA